MLTRTDMCAKTDAIQAFGVTARDLQSLAQNKGILVDDLAANAFAKLAIEDTTDAATLPLKSLFNRSVRLGSNVSPLLLRAAFLNTMVEHAN